MKRDLEIASEIQTWLLPVRPPPVPGVDIVFSTRPANTVAGDYYDVFVRPARTSANPSYLVAVADVAGKSIPAALLATFQASFSGVVEAVNEADTEYGEERLISIVNAGATTSS
jgi:sigma-B regulation protein RsbU (phosphoserine phosphatase)